MAPRTPTPELGTAKLPPASVDERPCKDLERMRQNPRDDWQASDIKRVCGQIGMTFSQPTRGSHFKTSSEFLEGALPLPARKPIRPVYIKAFVAQADAHLACKNAQKAPGAEKRS